MKELDSAMMTYVKQSPKPAVMKTEPQGRMNLSVGNCTQLKDFQDDKSYRSNRSGYSSRGSSHGFSLTQQCLKAELEEAKAKLEYTLREAKLKKEQASIEAELKIVGAQKDAAIGEARLRQDCVH